jgi:hypothetical protein
MSGRRMACAEYTLCEVSLGQFGVLVDIAHDFIFVALPY